MLSWWYTGCYKYESYLKVTEIYNNKRDPSVSNKIANKLMGNLRNASPCKPDMMFHICQVSFIINIIARMLLGSLRNTGLFKPNKIMQGENNTNLTCIRKHFWLALKCNQSNKNLISICMLKQNILKCHKLGHLHYMRKLIYKYEL